MRIAFDLDDTLIPTNHAFSVGSHSLAFPLNLIFKEQLRKGSVALMQDLSEHHEIWIYTTSLRNTFYIKAWFYCWGIRLHGVINHSTHIKNVLNTQYANFSKAPVLFNIAVMVDDLVGVQIECNQQNCHAIIIQPNDDHWVIKVKKVIKALEKLYFV